MDEAERCSRVGLMYGGRLIDLRYARPHQGAWSRRAGGIAPAAVAWTQRHEPRIGLLRRAEAVVASMPGVLEVQTYGDLLHLFVDDAALRMPQIEAALAAQASHAARLRRTQARMEEAFTSLIRRQESVARGDVNSVIRNTERVVHANSHIPCYTVTS